MRRISQTTSSSGSTLITEYFSDQKCLQIPQLTHLTKSHIELSYFVSVTANVMRVCLYELHINTDNEMRMMHALICQLCSTINY